MPRSFVREGSLEPGNDMHLYRRAIVVLVLAALIGLGWSHSARAEDKSAIEQAQALWQEGYVLHILGRYERAAEAFRKSIEAHPTAEGHTYLGWSLSRLGLPDEAIGECEKAILLDPDYGNPYNDIGAYLIELGRANEAMPWFEKAARAKRYCCYQFPHFNMGRLLLMEGRMAEAKRSFEKALEYEPDYPLAKRALELIREYERKTL